MARVRARWFLVAYIAALLGFAGAYTLIQGDFRVTNAMDDGAVQEDKERLLAELTSAVQEGMRLASGGPYLTVGDWKVDPSDFHFTDLTPTGDVVELRAYYIANRDTPEGPMQVAGPVCLSISQGGRVVFADENGGQHVVRAVTVEDDFTDVPLDALFVATSHTNSTGVGMLDIPMLVEDHLSAYVAASHGRTSASSGGFGRMLYLSAVTITTLGFGDIVPTTDRARLVIALEAVLGVLLIGLFLNLALGGARQQAPVQKAGANDRASDAGPDNSAILTGEGQD